VFVEPIVSALLVADRMTLEHPTLVLFGDVSGGTRYR
jgi:hypothetical protein